MLVMAPLTGGLAADEHSQHHPGGAPAPTSPPMPASNSGMGAAGGAAMGATSGPPGAGMGMMSGMMESMGRMGAPPIKELYPALMELPDLPMERRDEIRRRAHERMQQGASVMAQALDDLSQAAPRDDFASMQAATAGLRAGLGQFESGLAAHRALAEGKAPRNVAVQWFKREMNLLPPTVGERAHGLFGLSTFHYVTMAFTLAAALLFAGLFVARQRRATALADQLAGRNAATTAPAAIDASRTAPPLSPENAPHAGHGVRPAPTVSTTGSWTGQLRVARIFEETPDTKTFRLAPLMGEALPFAFEPGQFLTVSVDIEGKTIRRSYSISSSPCCQGWCELTVKHARNGAVSGYLHDHVKVGDRLDVAGPYGRFTFRGHEAPEVVMIAGGVGVTPLMSSIRFLTDQSWDGAIHLIYACARLDAVIFREELAYLAKRHANLHVTIVLSDEPSESWTGARGFVNAELLSHRVPDLHRYRIHLCGPPPMMEAVKKALAQAGVAADHVHTELFLSPEVKPAVAQSESAAVSTATCRFTRSGKTAPLPADHTILDAAEAAGVVIDYSCRQGFCGVCKVKLLSGEVRMEVEDGLSSADKAAGLVLACQAKATRDVAVEA